MDQKFSQPAGDNETACQGGFRLWHSETQRKPLSAAGD